MKYRRDHLESMQAALPVIDEVDKKFAAAFGRSYGGVIDTYRLDDADYALVTVGGMTGTARDVVDEFPFPVRRVREALANVKAFAVVDRSVSFGWDAGSMYSEVCAALGEDLTGKAHFSAIGGLGGADISMAHMAEAVKKLAALDGKAGRHDTLWLMD